MDKKYVHQQSNRTFRFSIGEDLEIDNGELTAMWSVTETGILVSTATHGEDATADVVESVCELTHLNRSGAEPLIRFWLSERLQVTRNHALESMLATKIPSLKKIYEHHPQMKQVSSLSHRLYSALRTGDNPRDLATNYFGDDSSRSDGTSFIDGLNVLGELDESRVALMVLVPPGDHRRSLSHVNCPKVWAIPSSSIRAISESLSVPVAIDFTKHAISDSRSRLLLNAASHLGIRATGNHGETAYRELTAQVLRSEISAPHSLLEKVVATGQIAGLTVMPIRTDRQLKGIAHAANNCIANPRYNWRNRVLQGDVEMFALLDGVHVQAVVALNPKTGKMIEKKGKNNADLDPQLCHEIQSRLIEVGGEI